MSPVDGADINSEYFGINAPLPPLADVEHGIKFSPDTIAAAVLNIYKSKFNIDKEIEPNLYKETVSIFNRALSAGFADALSKGVPMPAESFINDVKSNIDVFSAFRVHRMQKDIAALMLDEDGKLKPFSTFARDVKPYVSHQNRVWLETEYNTAVHRAQLASEWQQFSRDIDVYPNLRWVPTTSPNVGEDHRVFWNVIRPVKDDFWSAHHPGDRWNCKCSIEQTDKDVTPVPHGPVEKGSTPSRGLDNNPGKDAKLFNEKHPYFPRNCSSCPFKTANLRALFHSLADKKNCYACKNISDAINTNLTVRDAFIRIQNGEGNFRDNLLTIINKGQYNKVTNRIYSAISKSADDYDNLLFVAEMLTKKHRKAEIYILPNPKGVKSMDIIIKNKNSIYAYDVKTLTGLNSVDNRLLDSIGQSNRVILSIKSEYQARKLYDEIKSFFENNKKAQQVIIIVRNKEIILDREMMKESTFRRLYYK